MTRHNALRRFTAAAAILSTLPAAAISISTGSSTSHSSSLELSGITWAGDNLYYAVEDQTGALYPLSFKISSSGSISSYNLGTAVTLAGASDLEGCAWDPGSSTVWVSMESSSTPIREYDPVTGEQLRTAPVPSIFVSARRGNYSLEALTISGDGLSMWTANEESLTVDGERSTTSIGTIVRLQRFTRTSVLGDWVADGQWAYQTDTLRNSSSLASTPRSGISGLCALPDGSLLVLEREFSGLNMRRRIYKVDFTGATDVSSIASLAGATYVKVKKGSALLSDTAMTNWEGICLGPGLSSSLAALVVIADGGGGASPYVGTLKLSGLNVKTVYVSGNGSSEPVGGPYRVIAGSEFDASLAGAGGPYDGKTRVHDKWTAPGGASGTGGAASFAVSQDGTLQWSVATDPSVALLAADSFERLEAGKEVADALPGWSGEGWIAEATPPAPSSGYPLPLETHEFALQVDGDAIRSWDSEALGGGGTLLDGLVRVTLPQNEQVVADADGQIALHFDAQGRAILQHLAPDGSSRLRTVLSDRTFSNGDWVRVTFLFDYSGSAQGKAYVKVLLDGKTCVTASGVRSSSDLRSPGAWHRVLSAPQSACISQLQLSGYGAVDDIALYDSESLAPVGLGTPTVIRFF